MTAYEVRKIRREKRRSRWAFASFLSFFFRRRDYIKKSTKKYYYMTTQQLLLFVGANGSSFLSIGPQTDGTNGSLVSLQNVIMLYCLKSVKTV